MTETQRDEINRLLAIMLPASEAARAWERPHRFLRGGYMQIHPEETLAMLRAVLEGFDGPHQ